MDIKVSGISGKTRQVQKGLLAKESPASPSLHPKMDQALGKHQHVVLFFLRGAIGAFTLNLQFSFTLPMVETWDVVEQQDETAIPESEASVAIKVGFHSLRRSANEMLSNDAAQPASVAADLHNLCLFRYESCTIDTGFERQTRVHVEVKRNGHNDQ